MDHKQHPEQKMISASNLGFSGETYDPLDVKPYVPRAEDRVTVGKTAAMRDDWYDSVRGHLNGLPRKTPESQQLMKALGTAKQVKAPDPSKAGNNILADKDLEQVFPKDLPRQLVARTAVATGRSLDETSLDVRDSYIRHVNHKPWDKIQHDITEPSGQELTSKLTPVNESFHENYKGYGQTGLGSMSGRLTPDKRSDDEKQRPVNLWESSLEKGDQTLFKALRSGAFIDNASTPKEKEENAQAKARGVLEAALISRLQKMPDDVREKYLSGKSTYDGTMVSIDLLSGSGADSALAQEHHKTLRGLSGKQEDYDIMWDGKERHVKSKFDIFDFMTGVNAMNVKSSLGVPNPLSNDSSAQAGYNANSWQGLMNKASQPSGDKDRDKNVQALTEQIGGNLGRSGDYQLPAMLANLGNQLDLDVHFNCKSGKDRTGIMDAESKFMARQLDKQPGLVPNVADRRYRTGEQNHEHEQMLWESGSLDVLAKNVGGQCLKTADLATITGVGALPTTDKKLKKNLGGREKLSELGGLKRYADIDTIATFEEKNLQQKLEPLSDKKKNEYLRDAHGYMASLPPWPKALPQPPQQQQNVQNNLPFLPAHDDLDNQPRIARKEWADTNPFKQHAT